MCDLVIDRRDSRPRHPLSARSDKDQARHHHRPDRAPPTYATGAPGIPGRPHRLWLQKRFRHNDSSNPYQHSDARPHFRTPAVDPKSQPLKVPSPRADGLRRARAHQGKMVGLVRFELTTSCTPCKRATRLRYSPNRRRVTKTHGFPRSKRFLVGRNYHQYSASFTTHRAWQRTDAATTCNAFSPCAFARPGLRVGAYANRLLH